METEGIVQVGVNGEQRSRGALSGSDNTLAGKRNTKREPRKASREHQNGRPSPLPHFPGYYVREFHIFPGVLCASLPHFSGEPAIEKPARGLRQVRSRHHTAHLAIPLSQRRLAHKRAPLGHRPVRRAAWIAQADNGVGGYCPVPPPPYTTAAWNLQAAE